MHTMMSLSVIDLGAMNVLDAAPATPQLAAARAQVSIDDVYFTGNFGYDAGSALRWQADTIHAEGFTANHRTSDLSDILYWRRSLNVGTGVLHDQKLNQEAPMRIFVGPGCSDWLVADGPEAAEFFGGMAVGYSPPFPDECAPE